MNSPIDYEKPTHQIDDVLFDVKLQPVYSNFRWPNSTKSELFTTPNYVSVVNQSNGQILSVVGRNYRLIPNKVALEMGKELFCRLYPRVTADDLIPYKVIAPASLASAHIDLVHKDVKFDVWKQETWLPFLRISNSYNRTFALSFEVGFVRELCSNGVLFNKDTTKIKYVHSNAKSMNYLNDVSRIEETSVIFKNQCIRLKEYELNPSMMFPLVCNTLGVNLNLPEKGNIKWKIMRLHNLKDLINTLTKRYVLETGNTAYTALNVATDLVSHQKEYKTLTGFNLNIRSFYVRPTDWMEEFSAIAHHDNFDLNKYLEPTVKSLKMIGEKFNFKWN